MSVPSWFRPRVSTSTRPRSGRPSFGTSPVSENPARPPRRPRPDPILRLTDVAVGYRGAPIVSGASIQVGPYRPAYGRILNPVLSGRR